ncbi:MAG: ribosomal RNA small subunit methyltransferase G [Nitrospiraceae bacterium]|nr:MAG: ribosomal RNA small subunit methyltransferase G [Nitrospiraceae bacterium]
MFHVEQLESLRSLLSSGGQELGCVLSERHLSQFLQYLTEILTWNQKVNLSGITNPREIVVRHILDSLAGSKAIRSDEKVSLLDIGSGAGLPGVVLKIFRPDMELMLLEPRHKKAAFLRHVIGVLRLEKAFVNSDTLENFSAHLDHSFTHITIRALRPEPYFPLIAKLLSSGGRLILYQSKAQTLDDRFVKRAGLMLDQEISYSLPDGMGERCLRILASQCSLFHVEQ